MPDARFCAVNMELARNFLNFLNFDIFRKPGSISFSGLTIFPDLALAQDQDTYHSFRVSKSHPNLTVGSRARTIFVPRNYK